MWPTSPNKPSSTLQSQDRTKKVATGLPAFLLTQVFSQRIFSSAVPSRTTGALAVIVRSTPCAMVSASGSWPGADRLPSMWANPATTSSAIASWVRMHLSATVHTNISGSGAPRIIAASGPSRVLAPSGSPLATGCSHSTSEEHGKGANQLQRRWPKS